MIDWYMVAANGLWIAGLSVVVAAFSYHDWIARETSRPEVAHVADRPPSKRAPLRLVTGALLGALALWLALRGTDYTTLRLSVAGARPAWILAAIGSVALTVAVGVLRWRVLLEPVPAWRPLVDGIIIGQMLNIVLPIRLGEVARAYIVSRAESVPAARVLTTIAVEKLGDIVAVGLTAALLLALATLPAWVYGPGRALVITGVLAAVASIFGFRPGVVVWITRTVQRVAPASWRPRLERQFAVAAEGLAALRSRTRSLEFWLLSVAILLLAASTNYLLFLAFDLRLPAITALTLLLALQVGNTLISVPGNLGVFHYVIILVLTTQGVDRTAALGYAMVLYAVAILPKVAVGGILLAVDYRWVIGRGGVPQA